MKKKKIDNHVGDNPNKKCHTPPSITVDDSKESKQDEPTVTMTIPLPKTTLTPLMQVQKPIALFSNRLKGKKDQAYIDKIK